MNNLAQSEVFSLTLVIGTYLASLALYRKTRISLLHPLITSIFVIIVVLKTMDIEYESFQKGSHLIHFLLGPSVVALGYVLYEQIQYLKGNVISILTSVFVGAIVGIVSVIAIGELMGADAALVATLDPSRSRHRLRWMPRSHAASFSDSRHRSGGRNIRQYCRAVRDESVRHRKPHSQRVGIGASSHGVGTSVAIQIGAVEGALSGLAIGLMGIMTAILVPVISFIISLF